MPKPLVFLILSLPLVGAYAMYASGIVVIYQASRVVNLAHGAMATVPAYVVYSLVTSLDAPLIVAMPLGLATGALIGVGVERIFVRRLRDSGPTAQTVGTVAVFGLMIALAAKVWGTGGLTAPGVFPEGDIAVGSSILRYGQIGLLVVAVVATLALTALFRGTWLGLAMRGAAVNRRAASLMGVNPDRTSVVAWALGGALAALAGILLASVTVLHPYALSLSVLPAYVAALIGGMESLTGALIGSAIVGLVVGFVPVLSDLPLLDKVFGQVGGTELTLAVTAMIVMAARGARLTTTDVRSTVGARTVERKPRPALPKPSPRLVLALVVGWVFIPGVPFTVLGDANQALLYTIVAASLVLLTGWIGQISLAHAAFVGIGAFGSVQVSKRLSLPFPLTLPVAGMIAAGAAAALGAVALRVRGLYLAVATLIFAWMADLYLFSSPWFVGAGGSATTKVEPIGYEGGFPYFDFADRRTLYLVSLAGTALILFALANIRRSKTGRAFFAIRGSEAAAASLGIDVTRYKLLGFAMSGFIAGVAGNLLVVGQETIVPAQFTFTVSLLFLSIAVVGGLQSLGGAIASALIFSGLNELFFRVDALRGWLDVVSAGLLAIVLIFYPGGLARVPDAIAPMLARIANILRSVRAGASGPQSGPQSGPAVATAGAGRLDSGRVAIAAFLRRLGREMRGFGRELAASRDSILRTVEGRAPSRWRPRVRAFAGQLRGLGSEARAVAADARAAVRRGTRLAQGPEIEIGDRAGADSLAPLLGSSTFIRARPSVQIEERAVGAVLAAEDITVRFGGLVAVGGATIAIREGEIVGLIGPNGAGKTTMFNAMAGFVRPAHGRILLDSDDVTSLSVHERAARGVGRTFQAIQLATELTVRENLLVATHVRNPTGFVSHLVVGRRSALAEVDAAARVGAAARMLDIEDVLDRPAAGLPFGTLRMVEMARALVTGSPLIMLDEPASGLDDTETQRFAGIVRAMREELGISVLLIEHDVSLVMSLCDYVYVLDRGVPIAEGTPKHVQSHPAVIAAYLGGAESAEPVPAAAAIG